MCVRVYIFIIILILIGLRGPLTLRRRRGPSGLRPGMACTEHSTKCHTVTQTNKSNREEKGGEIERERKDPGSREGEGRGEAGGDFLLFFWIKGNGDASFLQRRSWRNKKKGREKIQVLLDQNKKLFSKL